MDAASGAVYSVQSSYVMLQGVELLKEKVPLKSVQVIRRTLLQKTATSGVRNAVSFAL